ncbi:conserved hypothetical protein [Xenorhabdus nematophila F1]|uniref:Uncharacterized protein n=1 Tax=Xenorhabdus nematophila (strain ATCC 19061 / DSM 3370 / CCUG 14189 / LMG 1036 / NCIMB 9965 / AN6) TaxID=406817 RepID=D3VK59_XENNA|nr:hypothetical protein XNC1_0740 [Xenorhabdus nematophila ATCC 19061]CCW30837.1 conserved hypothetical protein [Xenorhabdus nematophila F1]CEF30653.1 hypothetical protein XNW1_280001 [Xenorhabdus nematophila str. Websteri]
MQEAAAINLTCSADPGEVMHPDAMNAKTRGNAFGKGNNFIKRIMITPFSFIPIAIEDA